MKLDKKINLDHVFSVRDFRKLGSGNTLSYGGKTYTLANSTTLRLDTKMTVEVRETLTGEVILWLQGEALTLKETERSQRVKQTKKASSAPWGFQRKYRQPLETRY